MAGFRYAFSLSKDEIRAATPPGTAVLIDHSLERTVSGHHTHTVDHLLLVPQPSRDPADPLNWPKWRKAAILFCISIYAFIANFSSASLASALPLLAHDFYPITFAKLTHLIAVNSLMLGSANIWWVPLANIFGRRPIILICLLILTLSSVWCSLATSYNSLIAARIFQGIGGAAADTVAPDIVGEVFFVHQRGRAMAIYTVWLALGPIIGGIAGSYIAAANGWRWTQWTNVILSGALLLLCAFLQPETLFDREEAMRMSPTSEASEIRGEKSQAETREQSYSHRSFQPFTFSRSLKTGVYRGGIAEKFIAPYLTLRLPGVWVVMLQYGGLVGGIVAISTIGPQLVSMSPYLWGANAGLINVGGAIGILLGAVYTYILADRSLKRQAKHESHGYGEAEARLPTLFLGLFLATTGLWVFGFCAANPRPGMWVGLEFGLGMLTFGIMQIPSIGFNYIIEAYHSISGDCFVMVTFLRAVIGFAWTFVLGSWFQDRGAAERFGIFGMLMGIFSLLTIPLILYGKRMRIATAKWLPAKEDH